MESAPELTAQDLALAQLLATISGPSQPAAPGDSSTQARSTRSRSAMPSDDDGPSTSAAGHYTTHVILRCHRSGERTTEKRSKKVDCPFSVKLEWIHDGNGKLVSIRVTPRNGHFFHTPGDREDMYWLDLPQSMQERVREVRSLTFLPSIVPYSYSYLDCVPSFNSLTCYFRSFFAAASTRAETITHYRRS